jgi:tRNA wybutosine-synthesizing protein 3
MRQDPFLKQKANAMQKLSRATKAGEVDEPVVGLLGTINALPDCFTSSSCWGRIMLIDFAGQKGVSKFIARWHRTVSPEEVMKALETARGEQVWLRAEPFILHISCRDMKAAEKIIKIKNKAGIKRGGIFYIGNRVQIELEGTQRAEALVKEGERLLVDETYIRKLVGICNDRIRKNERDWMKLEKLFGELEAQKGRDSA